MTYALFVAGLSVLAGVSAAATLASVEHTSRLGGLGIVGRHRPIRVSAPVGPGAFAAMAAVPAGLLGTAIGGIPGAIAGIGVTAAMPVVVRRRRSSRRATAFQEQLPEGVSVIAAGLRSGRSLAQAIALAGDELAPPLGPSFDRVADRVALGEPLEEAVLAWARVVGGPDARLAAGVFGLHRKTGGALSDALDDLAATLRSRRSAGREIRALTAQARLSATVLGLLPIGFFLFLSVVAKGDVEAAFGTPAGSGAVVLGFTLQALAYLWIRRLLRVEP